MRRTRLVRLSSFFVCLLIAIVVVAFNKEVVVAATDAATGLTYTIAEGKATITGFTAPAGFDGALVIPETLGGASVTEIDWYAFNYFTSGLTSITIPNSVTSIGNAAFNNSSLNAIHVDSANTAYKSMDGVLYNKTGTTLIRCPRGKAGAFTIPNSVTGFENSAFSGCSALTEVTIPDSVTSIGTGAFSNCSALTSITIPNSVISIGYSAFSECSGLTSITIPNSVATIWYGAFRDCSALTAIHVDSANTTYKSMDGVLYDKTGILLHSCPGRKAGTFTIPNSVTQIHSNAFDGCSGLTSITTPDGLTSIGNDAFDGCSGLTSITIPNSVTFIGSSAFKGCSGLTSITIPNGETTIRDQAFFGCSALTSITIPNSVTSIGFYAFSWCDNLKDAYFYGNAPTLGNYVFESCAAGFTIHYLSTCTGYTNPWYGYTTAIFTEDPPAAPTNLTVTSVGYNSNKLTWDTVAGATGYSIYRSTSPDSGFTYLKGVTTNSYTNTGLTTGKTYYYQIKAYVMVGSKKIMSPVSATVSAKPVPAKPTGLKAVSTGYNSNKLTWTAVTGATGYSIYRSTSPDSGFTYLKGVTTNSCTDTSLKTGTTYYYQIKAYTLVGTTKVYSATSTTVSAKPIPAMPTGLKAVSAGYNSNKLTWTAVTGATGYSIYRSTSATGGFTYLKGVTGTSYTNTGLTTGTTYYYQIKAYVMVGTNKVMSPVSATVSAKPIPATPTGLKAVSTGYNSNKLTWNAVTGATGYSIYRSTSATGGFTYLKGVTGTSYTNTGLTTGTTYYYQVRAYVMVGTNKVMSQVSATVNAKPIPATPTGLKATVASTTSIKVSWNTVTGATGYSIYRSTSPDTGFTYLKGATGTSYTNTGLTTGTTYYYKVKAYTMVGTTKVYSTTTSAVNAKP